MCSRVFYFYTRLIYKVRQKSITTKQNSQDDKTLNREIPLSSLSSLRHPYCHAVVYSGLEEEEEDFA